MAIWKLTNLHKKNAVERQFWTKDGVTVIKEEGFRWGTWSCESDERPNVDLDNPDGWEQFSQDDEWEMEIMDDGCWQEWTFPDDMDEEEQERIQELWNEDSFEGLEGDGWSNDETEYWIYGPLRLTNEETGEEFEGNDSY
jgi:hypothetical protein